MNFFNKSVLTSRQARDKIAFWWDLAAPLCQQVSAENRAILLSVSSAGEPSICPNVCCRKSQCCPCPSTLADIGRTFLRPVKIQKPDQLAHMMLAISVAMSCSLKMSWIKSFISAKFSCFSPPHLAHARRSGIPFLF
jgi:hypothetical protein